MTSTSPRSGRTPEPSFAEGLSERSRRDLLNAFSKRGPVGNGLDPAAGSTDRLMDLAGLDAVVARVASFFNPVDHAAHPRKTGRDDGSRVRGSD